MSTKRLAAPRAFPHRVLVVPSFLLLLASLSGDLFAYNLLNPYRRWFPQDLPRDVYVDPRGRGSVNDHDHGVTAVLRGIEGWEDAQGVGDLLRPIKGSSSDPNAVPPYVSGDGVSVLRFDDPASICRGSCLAATTTGGISVFESGDCNGISWFRYTDSDIAFNPNYLYTTEEETDTEGGCSGEYYLEGISLHEVGHLLGLDHSNNSTAVMYAYANTCDRNKTRIQPDDAAGIQRPYHCPFSQGGVYADSDGDGYRQDTDCNDQDPTVHPGAAEICDLKDNDCDGTGDAGAGLTCADTCLGASGGSDGLRVTRGDCTSQRVPGVRLVYSRGDLAAIFAEGGVKHVEIVACPSYWTYDRFGESSPAAVGANKYYLVRDNSSPDYGTASDGTPRTPVEQPCP